MRNRMRKKECLKMEIFCVFGVSRVCEGTLVARDTIEVEAVGSPPPPPNDRRGMRKAEELSQLCVFVYMRLCVYVFVCVCVCFFTFIVK